MSTYVIGFVSDNDETYKKHAKVLLACLEAGIKKLQMKRQNILEKNILMNIYWKTS